LLCIRGVENFFPLVTHHVIPSSFGFGAVRRSDSWGGAAERRAVTEHAGGGAIMLSSGGS
jgi:hypothetical protein